MFCTEHILVKRGGGGQETDVFCPEPILESVFLDHSVVSVRVAVVQQAHCRRALGRPTSTRNVVMAFFRHFLLKTTIESYFVSQ